MKEQYLKRSETNKGAVINTDNNGLLQYKKAKQRYQDMQNDINILKKQVEFLLKAFNNK